MTMFSFGEGALSCVPFYPFPSIFSRSAHRLATGRKLFVVLEIQEVLSELRFGESIGSLVEVVGELPDGSEVGLLGAFAEAGQLEIVLHPLTKRRDHERVLSRRR